MSEEMVFTPVREAADLTPEILTAVEDIYDGWFEDEPRVDWQAFLDRLELWSHIDLGGNMDSPAIKAIKKHVRKYKNEVG